MNLTRRSWIFVALWTAGIAAVLWAGTRVDGYALHVQDIPLPHPYPWAGVLTMCATMTLATLVFYAIVRPESYLRSWKRALGATAVGAALVLVFGLGLMHAPPFAYAHWIWLGLTTLAFLLLSVVSGVRARTA